MQILLHNNDPLLADRACVTRPAHGLIARCAGCAGPLDAETPHIHILYGRDKYEGVCSEGCAIKRVMRIEARQR
jgi:hypothetical protein